MDISNFPQPGERLAYCGRVSTPKQKLIQQWEMVQRWQETSGLAIPAARRFEDHIRRHEAAGIIKELTDRRAKAGRKRYKFDDLMALVESRSIDWIVIASFDRWGISDKNDIFIFISWLRRYDVNLYSVQDNLNITGTDDSTFWQVAAKAQASTAYVSTMADNNIRKMVSMAQAGWAATGNNPFGIDLVCYSLTDLARPLFRVVRMSYKPHSYKIITYTSDSRVQRNEDGIIIASDLKVEKEELSPNMPPRDKKTTGYRYEPTVEGSRLEALKLMFEMAEAEVSFTDISARLWELKYGHYTKPFGYHGIEAILSNSAYIGKPAWGKLGVGEYRHVHKKTSTPIKRRSTDTVTVKKAEEDYIYPLKPLFIPIIDTGVFGRVKDKLAGRVHVNESFGKRRTRDKASHPLNGKVICPDCGKPMVFGSYMPGKGVKKKRFRSYVCGTYRRTNRSQCNANTVRWECLDQATEELLATVKDRIGAIEKGDTKHLLNQAWLLESEFGKIVTQVIGEAEAHLNSPKELDRLSQFVGTNLDTVSLGLDQVTNAEGVKTVLDVAFAIYERQFADSTAALTEELREVEEELEGIALTLPKMVRNPTIFDRLNKRAGELEARMSEIQPRLAPLTGRARAILDQLKAIKDTIEVADKTAVAGLLDSFLERVEPIFEVKEVGKKKVRRTEVVGFRFVPRSTANNVLAEEMKIGVSRTGSAQFHLISSTFAASVVVPAASAHLIPDDVMEQVISRYQNKESQAAIAAAMGLRQAVVRRILVDRAVPLRVRPPTSEEHRQAVLKMHAGGKQIKEISSELGLDFATVYRILRRAGRVKKRRS